MAASTYDEALRRLLVHEGGYSNHPRDPGGATNFGITLADYRRYLNAAATAVDVRTMSLGAAKRIYREHYWNVMRCDELSAGVDYCLFDYAVNSGTGRAPKVLQRCLGLPAGGRLDDATIRAAAGTATRSLIDAICDERLRFLQSLRTWPVFGTGWNRRVSEVRAAALAMADKRAAAAPAPTKTPAAPTPGKGSVPLNGRARKTTAGGTLATGGAAATQSNEPTTIVIVLVLTVAVAIGAWFFWRWWQRRQQEAPH
jgi:lysozyme family protein